MKRVCSNSLLKAGSGQRNTDPNSESQKRTVVETPRPHLKIRKIEREKRRDRLHSPCGLQTFKIEWERRLVRIGGVEKDRVGTRILTRQLKPKLKRLEFISVTRNLSEDHGKRLDVLKAEAPTQIAPTIPVDVIVPAIPPFGSSEVESERLGISMYSPKVAATTAECMSWPIVAAFDGEWIDHLIVSVHRWAAQSPSPQSRPGRLLAIAHSSA